jgi:hypothetical protein
MSDTPAVPEIPAAAQDALNAYNDTLCDAMCYAAAKRKAKEEIQGVVDFILSRYAHEPVLEVSKFSEHMYDHILRKRRTEIDDLILTFMDQLDAKMKDAFRHRMSDASLAYDRKTRTQIPDSSYNSISVKLSGVIKDD